MKVTEADLARIAQDCESDDGRPTCCATCGAAVRRWPWCSKCRRNRPRCKECERTTENAGRVCRRCLDEGG